MKHSGYVKKDGRFGKMKSSQVSELDVETLRTLEVALPTFPVVSFFVSNDTEYEEDLKQRLGDDMIPKRIRYKKLKQ